jgi:hypothetical protein
MTNNIQQKLNKKVAILSMEHPYEYAVLRYLFIAACVIVLAYLYFVSASVLNVIAEREADQSSAALETRIGTLEGEYFALNESITPTHATELGLQPIKESSFVYRLDTVGVVSVAHNAI